MISGKPNEGVNRRERRKESLTGPIEAAAGVRREVVLPGIRVAIDEVRLGRRGMGGRALASGTLGAPAEVVR